MTSEPSRLVGPYLLRHEPYTRTWLRDLPEGRLCQWIEVMAGGASLDIMYWPGNSRAGRLLRDQGLCPRTPGIYRIEPRN